MNKNESLLQNIVSILKWIKVLPQFNVVQNWSLICEVSLIILEGHDNNLLRLCDDSSFQTLFKNSITLRIVI